MKRTYNDHLDRNYSFVFDMERESVMNVKPGEVFTIKSKDAVDGKIADETIHFTPENLGPLSRYSPELSNPVFGPVRIRGTTKGDLLAVHILDIRVAEKGVTGIKNGQGVFADSKKWSSIFDMPSTKLLKNDSTSGEVIYSDDVRWPLSPFIGTIGVAQEVETRAASVIQSPWGGNWDCRHICKGSTLYLNACCEGGLLYLGDVHGSQGDGELSGIANEVSAEIDLSIDVIPQKGIPYARIETESHYVCIASNKPLEEAVRNAISYLMSWMVEVHEMNERDLYMILSTCSDFRLEIYQVVDLPGMSYTAGALLPKTLLPSHRR